MSGLALSLPTGPAGFERAFGACFEIRAREPVVESERTLYLMERREPAADRASSP